MKVSMRGWMGVAAAVTVGVVATRDPSPSVACGWDSETVYAEATSLACIPLVVVNHYPRHPFEYFTARIAAADTALRWAPGWLPGLDMKGVAQVRARDLANARRTLTLRETVDPDGYPTHANLGTLFTFTGDFDLALSHIDRAMTLEPQAHFGRERYHRMFVAFLRDARTHPAAARESFLGVRLSDAQRFGGSVAAFRAAGLGDDVFDALVSMITVYGADDNPHLYYALADALALRGERGSAWVAYLQAQRFHHPRGEQLLAWSHRLYDLSHPEDGGAPHTAGASFITSHGGWDTVELSTEMDADDARRVRRDEIRLLQSGLAVWTEAGLRTLYASRLARSERCRVPGVIGNVLAPSVGGLEPAPPVTDGGVGDAGVPPSAADEHARDEAATPRAMAYVALMEQAAAVHDAHAGRCPELGREVSAFATAHATGLTPADLAVFREIDHNAALRARMRSAMESIMTASMACRRDAGFTRAVAATFGPRGPVRR